MNEEMKVAWLEISDMLGEPTREELDVFMRTWQRAVQATRKALAEHLELVRADEREECAKVCDDLPLPPDVARSDASIWEVATLDCAEAIRARGQA